MLEKAIKSHSVCHVFPSVCSPKTHNRSHRNPLVVRYRRNLHTISRPISFIFIQYFLTIYIFFLRDFFCSGFLTKVLHSILINQHEFRAQPTVITFRKITNGNKYSAFCDVTRCGLLYIYQRLGGSH